MKTELKESEERYRKLMNILNDGVIIHNIDKIVFPASHLSEYLTFPIVEKIYSSKYPPHHTLSLKSFKYTSKTDISAGETPEILEACPIDAGRISFNFCFASIRRLGIFS